MRIVKYTVVVLLISCAALYLLYTIYDTGYRRHYAVEMDLMNERLNGHEPSDILFLGSSRMFRQVNPRVVDSLLGYRSYNAGLDGIKLVEMNMILECYLQSHPPPRLVVMDLPPASFNGNLFPFFNQTLYYPFLNNPVVYREISQCRPAGLFRSLPFFRLTEASDETRQRALAGLFGRTYSSATDYYRGFVTPLRDTLKLPFTKPLKVTSPIDAKGIGHLKRTIALCRARNVSLMIVYPPNYKSYDLEGNPDFYSTAAEICEEEGVPIRDYRNLYLKDDHRFFRDQTHLNAAGTEIFSRHIAADIQHYFATAATKSKSLAAETNR